MAPRCGWSTSCQKSAPMRVRSVFTLGPSKSSTISTSSRHFWKAGKRPLRLSNTPGGQRIQEVRYDEIDAAYPFMLHIEQWKTEGLLEKRLGELGCTVERETELIATEERLDGVRTTLRSADGSTDVVDVPWLIGCYGAHSTVRHLNHQRFPGEADPRKYMIADVTTDPPIARDAVCTFLSAAGALFCGPLPNNRTLIFGNVGDASEPDPGPPTLKDIQELVDARYPKPVVVGDPHWINFFRVNYRLTPHYRHGRTFLAGDAAHIHSSVGGQGMNTGMQDAYNLGWKLALVCRGRAPEALLDSYEKERRAVAEDVLALTKSLAEHAYSYAGMSVEERDRYYYHAHVPEAERVGKLRRMAELDLDYRKSPICVEHSRKHDGGEDGGPHAGAEAIDAGPLELNGTRHSLFELLAGPQHTLLLFTGADPSSRRQVEMAFLASEVERVYGALIRVLIVAVPGADAAKFGDARTIVRDLEGNLRDRYRAEEGHVYLIRPDGYVGWRSDRPSLAAFRDYLARVFVCP
jgi:2-polyprenyl-6-methoxyphenol hydroxylase-like FAD-dependent oxidoreductase